MISIVTLLWDVNAKSYGFSRYDESWVEKLYQGCAANLTQPFRFRCFTERARQFRFPEIETVWIEQGDPIGYDACIEPYRLDEPMILMGLDTIITGNIDHLAHYCLNASKIAVPRDPFFPQTVCNGVALVPGGKRAEMFDAHCGENDMEWVRQHWREGRIDVLDDIFPGEIVSYKGDIAKNGLTDATRIVFFHGYPKAPDLPHVGWIYRNWHALGKAEAA